MSTIANPKDKHCVVLHDPRRKLKMIVPDTIEALQGEFVEWVVEPSNLQVTITFDPSTGTPLNWTQKKGVDGDFKGVVARGAKGFYKYTVEDDLGNVIDPRMRIKR